MQNAFDEKSKSCIKKKWICKKVSSAKQKWLFLITTALYNSEKKLSKMIKVSFKCIVAIPAPHPRPGKEFTVWRGSVGGGCDLGSMSLHPPTEESRRNVDKDGKLWLKQLFYISCSYLCHLSTSSLFKLFNLALNAHSVLQNTANSTEQTWAQW